MDETTTNNHLLNGNSQTVIDLTTVTTSPNYNFPGIFVPDHQINQPYNQQHIIDLFKQRAHTGMLPISPATDHTIINNLIDDVSNLKNSKDRKAQCLHMLTDLFFNRQKLTFEECQNLLGMINSIDEENLTIAEIILKNKSNGREQAKP